VVEAVDDAGRLTVAVQLANADGAVKIAGRAVIDLTFAPGGA
jgi:hypothetical protein